MVKEYTYQAGECPNIYGYFVAPCLANQPTALSGRLPQLAIQLRVNELCLGTVLQPRD
jgi:hypothetical protein